MVVTGGSGFIGTNLVEHLVEAGDRVVNLDLSPPQHPDHGPLWVPTDILDGPALTAAMADAAPDAVVHLAARCDLAGATVADYRANTDGTVNLIAAARHVGVARVLFGSSQLVCTPGHVPTTDTEYSPPNPYGESKVIGERLVREGAGDDMTWVLLRPTSIWGPWFGPLYSAFFTTVRRGLYVHPRGVRIRKAFGYVGNAVHQIARVLDAPPETVHGSVMYISDYEPYPILDWARLVADEFDARRVREVPVTVLRAGARVGDLLQRAGMHAPPLSSYRLRNMLTETVFDMEPVRAVCGDLPYSWEDGTRTTVRWMRSQDTSSR
ncbi:MAG: NAD-dependent epimerase/dehydratase family protein [Acidimicrobiales bacterium]